MSVTAQLLKVFRVEQQLRGLQSRLHVAERFLAEQEKQLGVVTGGHAKLLAELKGLKTTIAGEESEATSIDARMGKLRDQMNECKTNKEYSAFLAELNALKSKKDELERVELGQMERAEAVKAQVEALSASKAEREAIVSKARKDRDAHAHEIKDRLAQLNDERAELAKEIPGDALRLLAESLALHGDEAMSTVEVIDRRNHEWSCSNCQMTLPVELVNAISMNRLTRCNSCKCILFTQEDVVSKKKPKENEDIVKTRKKVAAKKANGPGEKAAVEKA